MSRREHQVAIGLLWFVVAGVAATVGAVAYAMWWIAGLIL